MLCIYMWIFFPHYVVIKIENILQNIVEKWTSLKFLRVGCTISNDESVK
jgi:hypothetical protein